MAVFQSHTQNVAGGFFFELTQYLSERLVDSLDTGGNQVRETLRRWSQLHGLPPDAPRDIAWSMPVPFCILISMGQWRSSAIPLCKGNASNGLGYGLARPLVGQALADGAAAVGVADGEAEAGDMEVSERGIQHLADHLRAGLRHADTPSLRTCIGWVQSRRDSIFLTRVRCDERAHMMETLIMAVLASSNMRSADGLKDTIERRIRLVIQDAELLAHYLQLLLSTRIVPSPSSVIRHRLTLQIGFQRWQADIRADLLTKPGGCVSWRTVDSSPQGGWDWVFHGGREVAVADLARAYELSLELNEVAVTDPERGRQAHSDLAVMMKDFQGAPAAVGSGKAGAMRKLQAVSHSQRLGSPSWPATAELLSSSMTWTGDLGTESYFCRTRVKLTELFGDWTQALGEGGGGGGGEAGFSEFDYHVDQDTNDNDDGFEFHPEDRDELDHGVNDALDDTVWFDLTKCILIAGLLHIIHKATDGLELSLSRYSQWLYQV